MSTGLARVPGSRRILVTGASGFIGGHLVRELAARGIQVIATGRDERRLAAHASYAHCVACDLVSGELSPLTANVDAIVHCAALASPWGRAAEFRSINVEATQRLLEAALRAGVSRFVHISSPSIYFQFGDHLDIPESFVPRQAVNDYARTKREAEDCVLASHRAGLPAVILRPRAVFGEGDTAIFPRVLRVARRGFFPLFGGGDAHIDVTYVGNVVAAIWQALNAESDALGRAFNITNGTPLAVRSLLEQVFKALRYQVRFVRVPRPVAMQIAGSLERLARASKAEAEPALTRYSVGVLAYSQTLDISAARRYLNYEPRWTITQGIERYAQWFLHHAAH